MSRKTIPTKNRRRGVFITFEGIEGSGKTTQLARLAKFLREKGYRVMETREPGGGDAAGGTHPRDHVEPDSERTKRAQQTYRHRPMTPECEAALVFAARAQHVTHILQPALQEGAIVLCDRFADSTLAYQWK
jgi:dTMP kinase